ncbi:MAG: NUDIX domain-containing protein [Pseudoclavibacter sp.]|jgi:8-oxo-dGTP pyrophosphatase MutT (NUDIX family)
MPTPDFVLRLRRRIGHDPLWLSGVTALIVQDGQVLLVRRADTGAWTPVTGIIEPGEQPSVTAIREAREETGVRIRVDRLVRVRTLPPVTYPNGDQCQYLDVCLACHPLGGQEPRIGDDENTDAGWFPLDALPDGTTERTRSDLATLLRGGPAVVG